VIGPPKTIRVLLADDHLVLTQALTRLLGGEEGLEVVAAVADGEQAWERIEALSPQVAVVDVNMPRLTGIELARKVRDAGLRTAVVILSMHREASFVRASLNAGASAYVLKEADESELIEAVRSAAAGDVFVSPALTSALAADLRADERGARVDLSPRERDVLRLLAEGLANKEIAQKLFISVRTVDGHRAAIMKKLGVHNLPALVKIALKLHLTTLEE
jgi:DNA-binding NarL/FixJ family response regulator